MAIGTTAAIMGGLTLLKGGMQIYQGAKEKSQAASDLENYDRQDVRNPAKNLRVSKLGATIQREELARQQANVMDIVKQGGARAIIGATGKIQAQQNAQAQKIGYDMDNQMLDREKAIVQGDYNAMRMQERREEADLAGLGNQMMVGNQDMWTGASNMAQAGMFLANNASFEGKENPADVVDRSNYVDNSVIDSATSFNYDDPNNAQLGTDTNIPSEIDKYNNSFLGGYSTTRTV